MLKYSSYESLHTNKVDMCNRTPHNWSFYLGHNYTFDYCIYDQGDNLLFHIFAWFAVVLESPLSFSWKKSNKLIVQNSRDLWVIVK